MPINTLFQVLGTLCFTPMNTLFHIAEHFVSCLRTLCSKYLEQNLPPNKQFPSIKVIGDRLGDRLKNNLSPLESPMNKQIQKVGDRLIEKSRFFL